MSLSGFRWADSEIDVIARHCVARFKLKRKSLISADFTYICSGRTVNTTTKSFFIVQKFVHNGPDSLAVAGPGYLARITSDLFGSPMILCVSGSNFRQLPPIGP